MVGMVRGTSTRNRDADRAAWGRFGASKCAEQRDQLVRRYLPLLIGTATAISRRMPAVTRHDAISNGFFGLTQAVDRFQPERGLSFSTFACPRIRGAILDAVRSESVVPRKSIERRREVSRAEHRIGTRKGRKPTHGEVAEELGISTGEFWSWHDQRLRGQDTSLDAPAHAEPGASWVPAAEVIPDPLGLEFAERVDAESDHQRVRRSVAALPPRERQAVEARFFEDKSYAEVGRQLGVSTSRACEIVQLGLGRLRARLAAAELVADRRVG